MDIRALAYIRIEATELAPWRDFGTGVLGMMEAPGISGKDRLYLKMDAYSYRYLVYRGQQDAFSCAGWEVAGRSGFETALAGLDAAGIAYKEGDAAEAAERNVAGFASLEDPGGQGLEICYNPRLDYAPLISSVGVTGFETGYHGRPPWPAPSPGRPGPGPALFARQQPTSPQPCPLRGQRTPPGQPRPPDGRGPFHRRLRALP